MFSSTFHSRLVLVSIAVVLFAGEIKLGILTGSSNVFSDKILLLSMLFELPKIFIEDCPISVLLLVVIIRLISVLLSVAV